MKYRSSWPVYYTGLYFFSHYDAGKLLSATETRAGCGTLLWRYAYDLMGNRTLEEKKNPGGKVCYTYDEDGNLLKEYSSMDNSLISYQYTVEARLEAAYGDALENLFTG